VLGLGAGTRSVAPTLDDLQWTPEEQQEFTSAPIFPS
jgi:hypothetical protein